MRVAFHATAIAVVLAGGATADRASSSRPSRPTEGTLRVNEGGRLVDVPLRHTAVRIDVAGFLADVKVEQTFINPYEKKIDAVYQFPLPTRAAVNEMEMVVGGRTIRGQIDRRTEARRKYDEARGEGHVAALLTQERPNLFTQAVANLEPGVEVLVRLRYVQPLAYEAGGYELVFPMVAGPRYTPAAKKTGGAGAGAGVEGDGPVVAPVLPPGFRSLRDISVEGHIDAGVPTTDVSSPSHHIVVDAGKGRVTLAPDDAIPNKDFILRYRVAGARPQLALLTHRAGGAAAGSFFLLAQPPQTAAPTDITPREMVFVVDTSSSMAGAPLDKAKEVVRRALEAMGPDDTFQIIRFDDRAGALGDRPLANHARNVQLALAWLDHLEAGGGTEMAAGVAAALDFPHDPARLRIVAFLTDGYIGNEDEVLALVGARLRDSRLFSFGVGSAVNRYLLEEMARIGRGAVEVVRPDEDTTATAGRFHDRIARPLLTDVRIDWGGLDVAEQVPAAVPDLFLGQPLVVAGRYRRAGAGVVTVHARQAGLPVDFQLPVSLPERDEARPAVASVWARARIAELSGRLLHARGPEAPPLREQITAIALENHMMSPYTAFVAVDSARVTAGGPAAPVAVPVEVPQGVRHRGVQGFGVTGVGYGGGYAVFSGYGHGAVGYLERRVATAPIILPGTARVRGSLDPTIVRLVFRRHHNEVKSCYELDLQRDHTLTGRLVLELTVDGDGHVRAAVITESELPGAAVGACVVEAARRWSFPSVLGGGETVIRHPYVFQPSQPETAMKEENEEGKK